jgi:hypothetical protein
MLLPGFYLLGGMSGFVHTCHNPLSVLQVITKLLYLLTQGETLTKVGFLLLR